MIDPYLIFYQANPTAFLIHSPPKITGKHYFHINFKIMLHLHVNKAELKNSTATKMIESLKFSRKFFFVEKLREFKITKET